MFVTLVKWLERHSHAGNPQKKNCQCWDNITCGRVVAWLRGHVSRGTSVARSLKLLALPY